MALLRQNTGKSLTRMPASYKNTHKRVKRLAQVNLIEEIKGKYRGAQGIIEFLLTDELLR